MTITTRKSASQAAHGSAIYEESVMPKPMKRKKRIFKKSSNVPPVVMMEGRQLRNLPSRVKTRAKSEKKVALKSTQKPKESSEVKASEFNPKMVNGMWECCGLQFKHNFNFYHHRRRMHPEIKSRKRAGNREKFCMICFRRFESYDAQYEHRLKGTCRRPRKCPPYNPQKIDGVWHCCGVALEGRLREHRKKVHPDVTTINTCFCHFCGAKFDTLKALHKHKKSCELPQEAPDFKPEKVGGKWKCCGTVFEKLGTFHMHKFKWHREAIRQTCFCRTCCMRFENYAAMRGHQRSGKCKPVDKGPEYNPKFVNGGWECCGLRYRTTGGLGYHKTNVHPNAVRERVCICKCSKKFQRMKFLVLHKKAGRCPMTTGFIGYQKSDSIKTIKSTNEAKTVPRNIKK